MPARTLYQVLLLPSGEVVARHQSLAEASAWVHTYHEALGPTKARDQVRAVIAEESLHVKTRLRRRIAVVEADRAGMTREATDIHASRFRHARDRHGCRAVGLTPDPLQLADD